MLSTTKEPFTIPNILPYVHHWQCGLCCPVPESFTIPSILPYVHHWQCGLCCQLPNSLLQYLISYHMSITDNVVFVVQYQSFTIPSILPLSITGNVVFGPVPESFTIPNILHCQWWTYGKMLGIVKDSGTKPHCLGHMVVVYWTTKTTLSVMDIW